MKRILVVDDERDLCEILRINLELTGYVVDTASSAEEALKHNLSEYDLLLLDVMMEGMSGFDMARRLKADQSTAQLPIIFITAKDAEDDVLRGFGLGADDYITKPFSLRQAMARIRAVLARTASTTSSVTPSELSHQGLVINTLHQTATADGQPLALTKTEYELLCLLMRERGHVLSRSQLISGAWPEGVVVTDRAVDVNITRLRKKLGTYARYIISRPGFGYMFNA